MPVIGLYDSRDVRVIDWQLQRMREAGIDCLFISWWGPGGFEDEAARRVFWRAQLYGLKAAIFVEPYLGNDPSRYDRAFWEQTLAYIKQNFIDRYPGAYLRLDGKPLVLAFNPIGLAYDPRPDFPGYAIRIVGNDIDSAGYQDWDYWPDYDNALSGELRVRRDGYVVLTPRYRDDHFRSPGLSIDYDLSQGWYERQWEWVLRNLDRVRLIAITSWNEYHENTFIEPANDPAIKDPYYLYNSTKQYIAEAKARGQYWGLPEAAAAAGGALAAAIALARAVALARRI
ncbi:hypothetical protein APE_0727 [Aeropyrum pernix ovoid virus 1]|uniref:Uncharacterized protein n=2 Tax=root TaxID=1 RepID=Q9YE43_AERPE|nr:hypothetical protein [Aeropyrum pernix]YP_009177661.1 hypothetical protein ASQ65_gp10 [Aeropyrum pernix ovoid virus 1]BAA79703.1 hypothetical protein APE_0727 [Aeropyrum pernix ovoid virus 1] [Aeropyrum pernix K1]CCD22151.1 TPA: hypothetical protein [Aeropyrum pernix ovoid virus 1]